MNSAGRKSDARSRPFLKSADFCLVAGGIAALEKAFGSFLDSFCVGASADAVGFADSGVGAL